MPPHHQRVLTGREVPGWRQVRRTLCLESWRMNSAESLEAKRPHMVSLPRCLPSITSGGTSRVKADAEYLFMLCSWFAQGSQTMLDHATPILFGLQLPD